MRIVVASVLGAVLLGLPGRALRADRGPATIGEARIVFLSEELHGVGATFHARTRLIKFLHQQCGFDVLAFESGLYDCRKVWQLLREGKMPAREAISQGVFDIWASTEELQPMFQYLARQARQGRPLEVCGFDCQFTAGRGALPAASGRGEDERRR